MNLLLDLVELAFNEEDQYLIAQCIDLAKTKYIALGDCINPFNKELVVQQACSELIRYHSKKRLINEIISKSIRVYWHESTVWCEKILRKQ